jgi:cellobiose-specific phosphotransferase system component IIA
MKARIQMYIVVVAASIAVLFGVSTLIMTNISSSPIAFASSSSSPLSAEATTTTTNQTGNNQTSANVTTTTTGGGGGGDQETATKQLDQAMKALESGDNAAAEGYMKEADKTLPEGQAKMHLSEAMKALQADDIEGAKTHTQFAIDNL